MEGILISTISKKERGGGVGSNIEYALQSGAKKILIKLINQETAIKIENETKKWR